MTNFRIEVVVDPKEAVDGSKKVGAELDKLEDKATSLKTLLAGAFVAIGGVALIRELVGMTDAWTDLNSRVRVAVGSQALAEETMGRLSEIARRTYSDLNLTAESFLLNSTALRELGYNTQQQLDYTESLNNALVVSGAKGDRARTVTEALAKAMAFGTLQGENLNTVIQSGGRVAEALATGLGVTTNQLRQLGAEGKITTIKAIQAITSQMETLRAEAESMPATVGDAFVILKNNLLEFVGKADEASGVSTSLSAVIIALAGNLHTLAAAALTAGGAYAAIRLAPIATEALAAAVAFVRLQVAVATGSAVVLGSAAATAQQAAAEVAAAEAIVAKTAANVAEIESESSKALVVVGSNDAIFAQIALEQQAAAAEAEHVAATTALTAAQERLAAATAATSVQARILAAINPFAIAVIAIAAFGFALNKIIDATIEYENEAHKAEAAAQKFALTDYGKLGDDILRVKKNLADAERTLAGSNGRTTAATQLVEQYRAKLKELTEQQEFLRTGQARSAAQAQALQKATEDLAKSSGDYLADLEKENDLLKLGSREREIQSALRKEIATLNKGDGPKLTDPQKEALELAIRHNQALREQAAVLDDVRGPQEKYDATVAASKVLFDAHTISLTEYTRQLEKAKAELASGTKVPAIAGGDQQTPSFIGPQPAPPPPNFEPPTSNPSGGPSFEEILANLDKQNEALTLGNDERQRQAQLEQVLAEVKASGYPIDDKGIEKIKERLALGQKLEEDNAVAIESERQRIALIDQRAQAEQAAIEHIKGPQAQLAETQDILKGLYDSGTISLNEYTYAMNQASLSAQGLGLTAGEGLTSGLEQIQNHLLDVGGAVQDTLVNGFKAGEDALVSFVRTGKADFSGFVDQILDDLARLAIQQALSGIFGASGTPPGGGGGGGFDLAGLISGIFGGARAGGGDVQSGKSYLVGEKGPEIFHTPSGGGNIVPAGETAAALRSNTQAPVVNVSPPNVQIVNVSDPSEIPKALQTQAGEEAVMNVISRKRQTVKGLTK